MKNLKTKLNKIVNYSGYNGTKQKLNWDIVLGNEGRKSLTIKRGSKVLIEGVNHLWVAATYRNRHFHLSHSAIDWK